MKHRLHIECLLTLISYEINWQYMFIPILTTIAAMVFAFAIFPKDCYFERKYNEAKDEEREANKALRLAKEKYQDFSLDLLTKFNITNMGASSSYEDILKACEERLPLLEMEQIKRIYDLYPGLLQSNYFEAVETYLASCKTRLHEIAQKQGAPQATLQQISNISIEYEVLIASPSWKDPERTKKLIEEAKAVIPLPENRGPQI